MLIRCDNCFEQYEKEYEICPHCGHVLGDPSKELYHLYPGMVLNDRYIIGKVLGFGGFGITYKVWDCRLETILAIKEYYPSGLVNRVPGTKNVILFTGNRMNEYNHGLTRFLDEARNMAKFSSHKSIINIFEYFEENNTAYIVMEYLEGLTLSEFLKMNRLDVETCVQLTLSICAALQDIHAAGIIHRDVSPDNIFLCTNNNTIKLIDFGAARFSFGEDKLMTIILKPGFAPPEQYEKVNLQGSWTDIYALGATLYFMITGIKPEESTNRKIADTLSPPMELDSSIPEYISNTVMKAMAIDKHLRFSSVSEFEQALNRERKVLPVAKELKMRKRRRFAGVLSSALVIVVFASIFAVNWNREKEAETLPDAAIAFWYTLSGNSNEDTAKNDAFAAIVSAFNSSFPNVTVEIKAISQDIYAKTIKDAINAGKMPALFESTDMDDVVLSNAIDLSRVVNEIGKEQCYFLDRYNTYFTKKNQLPLSFNAPVVYLNTTLLPLEEGGLKDIGVLFDTAPYAIQTLVIDDTAAMAFSVSYGDTSTKNSITATKNAEELFLSGQAVAYFADTSGYFTIQETMPARYKLLYADSAKIRGSFNNLWSIGHCSEDEQKAAERLLVFLLSDNAQDYLHIRNRSQALPLNKHVLEVFCTVYNDFDGFFSNISNYDFVTIN